MQDDALVAPRAGASRDVVLVVEPSELARHRLRSVLREGDRDYLVFHAYDSQHSGTPTLRISPLYWTPDGWPRAQL